MDPITRLVIIGSGNIANTYIAAIENIENAQTVGVISRSKNKPSKYPQISSWTSLDSVDQPFDAVVICTPNAYHHVAAIEAAKMNKHVLCEKPVDISLAAIDKMITACRTSNVKLGIAYQRRFSSDNPLIKEMIDSNKLGKIFSVDLSVKNYRDDAYYNSAPYRGTRVIDGGGPFMQQASHYIDLYYWYFGMPEKLVSKLNTFVHDIDVEDHGSVICWHQSGMIGTITASTATKPGFPAKLEIYSDKGYLIMENDVITEWDIDGLENPSMQTHTNKHSGSATAVVDDTTNHEFVIKDFIEAIEQNRDPLITGESARNANLFNILVKYDFTESDARICAEIFAENTLVGVASHGINRFPEFIRLTKLGHVVPSAKPVVNNSFNALERWDGRYGPGPLNALFTTERSIELAREYGIGCVALKNTNHWMRAGYYGWEAAKQGIVFICWTNTIPIMSPWGSMTPKLGNNPIVFAAPAKNHPVVLDMALAQYSYGKLASYFHAGKELPYYGGYDANGKLTRDARAIYTSMRPLPIGLWKGAGLALLLDLIGTILSAGKSIPDLGKEDEESGVTQIFIAIDPSKFSSRDIIDQAVDEILGFYISAEKSGADEIIYPGQRIVKTRAENLKNGVPIEKRIWEKVNNL
jgi:LDH2 family malate/lactate/ureidoglycolate dehydrogenase/predicted dehydrogenase